MSHARPRLSLETIDGVTVVSFVDKQIVTDEAIQEVGDQLHGLVNDARHTQLLLNFTNVDYLSSMFYGKLINLKATLEAVKGQLKLCCVHPDLFEGFKITRLDRVFEFYNEEAKALARF